jgi:hypothetical protein
MYIERKIVSRCTNGEDDPADHIGGMSAVTSEAYEIRSFLHPKQQQREVVAAALLMKPACDLPHIIGWEAKGQVFVQSQHAYLGHITSAGRLVRHLKRSAVWP